LAQDKSVFGSLVSSVVRVMLKVAFRFEPLAPTAISLLLYQQLHRYREEGIISNYKSHTKRLGKYHYRIEVDLDVTDRQALHLLANVFPKQFRRYGRWFYD
jgi:hypothetical protein